MLMSLQMSRRSESLVVKKCNFSFTQNLEHSVALWSERSATLLRIIEEKDFMTSKLPLDTKDKQK